jgi:hypothetical protein
LWKPLILSLAVAAVVGLGAEAVRRLRGGGPDRSEGEPGDPLADPAA